MSHAAGGRHRATEPPRRPTSRGVWAVVGVLLIIVGLGVSLLWPNESPTVKPRSPASPGPAPEAPSSPSEPAPTVESSRDVTVDGQRITVEEVSTVVDGTGVRAIPAESVPLGLELVDTSVVTPNGRSTDFDTPVTLDPSGTLTVRSRYRLTACPDVIPTQWPSPAEFPDATRTYLRLDGPLHTAYALCPTSRPDSQPLPGLSGLSIGRPQTSVRLAWQGEEPLTVLAVGSASGVAAVVPDPSCESACVATVDAGSSQLLRLTRVDPCPPATDDDLLVLVVEAEPIDRLAAVQVPGLSEALCS